MRWVVAPSWAEVTLSPFDSTCVLVCHCCCCCAVGHTGYTPTSAPASEAGGDDGDGDGGPPPGSGSGGWLLVLVAAEGGSMGAWQQGAVGGGCWPAADGVPIQQQHAADANGNVHMLCSAGRERSRRRGWRRRHRVSLGVFCT